MPIDYSKAWIYKLKSKDPEILDFYLGYSTFPASHLFDMLKRRCQKDTWFVCSFIREHGGIQNFELERTPSEPCSNAREIKTELWKHFDATPPSLNKRMPLRCRIEYSQGEIPRQKQQVHREKNLERIRELHRTLYQKNKDDISISRKIYYTNNSERTMQSTRDRRARIQASKAEVGHQPPEASWVRHPSTYLYF
jgi:hypothetical protein